MFNSFIRCSRVNLSHCVSHQLAGLWYEYNCIFSYLYVHGALFMKDQFVIYRVAGNTREAFCLQNLKISYSTDPVLDSNLAHTANQKMQFYSIAYRQSVVKNIFKLFIRKTTLTSTGVYFGVISFAQAISGSGGKLALGLGSTLN